MRARIACLVFAVIAGMVVVGCGSKDDSSSSTPPPSDKVKSMSGPTGAAPKAASPVPPPAPN